MAPDRGAAYSGNGNLLVLSVPQARTHGIGISKSLRVERQGIPTITKVLISPTANDRQPWTKGLLHHIFRIADENGCVAQVGEPCDVLYIVSIAVGAQKGLALISLHWQAPNKVGHKDKRLPLQFRIFMIVIVHIPCLVSDDEIVVLDRKSVV